MTNKTRMKPKPITARLPDIDDGPMIVQIRAEHVAHLPLTMKNQLQAILNRLARIKHEQRQQHRIAA